MTQFGSIRVNVIISVGYRVKSHRDTQFRICATQRLNQQRIGVEDLKALESLDKELKQIGKKH